jgi:hypothetical protein
MALIITPKLQKALEIASSIEEVVSVQAIEPPQNILDQIENKDSVYLDFVIQTKSGETEFAIVVPKVLVESADESLHIPIKDLLLCGCTQIDDGVGHICGYGVFDNIGKMTYYVRESDQYLIKLIDTKAPDVFVQPDNLKKLIKKLEALDGVKRILVEEIIDEKLKENLETKTPGILEIKNPVIIKAYIDINNDKITDYFVSIAVTKLVYDNENSHKWAVNSLIDLIEKNNT